MRAGFADDEEPRKFFGPTRDSSAAAAPGAGDAAPPPPVLGDPLSAEAAEELMSAVGPGQLPAAWNQGLFFAGYQPYGLQQVEGGPCGVIAVVQAFLIRALMERGAPVLEVDEKCRQEALVDAVCEVLFRNVGDGKRAFFLLPSSASATPLATAQLRCLQPVQFASFEQMRCYLAQRPYREALFSPSGCGLALLLYSLVWTRGVRGIRESDADDPQAAVMIGGHGYCTQELVNLMIFGRAYSNVFDGTKRIGSATEGWTVLQGVPRRANVGFLSLFEAFKCIEVGSRYKGPTCPVWVVCAESHYTTLFAADPHVDAKDSEQQVELYYFDQLARQSEQIKLSILPKRLPSHLVTGFEDGESMIDRCIRTKWRDANVDWNGTEPIL